MPNAMPKDKAIVLVLTSIVASRKVAQATTLLLPHLKPALKEIIARFGEYETKVHLLILEGMDLIDEANKVYDEHIPKTLRKGTG